MSLLIDLSPDEEAVLRARAKEAGLSAKDYAKQELARALTGPPSTTSSPTRHPPDVRPIWEVILENMEDVPPEAFEKLPRDSAAQIDHYLYGHPKR